MQPDTSHNIRMNRFHSVTEILQDWIKNGVIKPGHRLPAERKLARDLNVSRTSIREALLVLEQKDLVEIRRGTKGGAYVKEPSPQQLVNGMNHLLQIKDLTFDQVVEFRQAIEMSVAAMAAQKADSEDISILKHQLGRARSFVGRGNGWGIEFIEADKNIHICIAQISKNPLSVQALKATLGLGGYFDRFHGLHPCLMEKNYNDLHNIVEAIGKHQSETASNLAETHIRRFNTMAIG